MKNECLLYRYTKRVESLSTLNSQLIIALLRIVMSVPEP